MSNTILKDPLKVKEEEDGQGHNGKIISLNGLVLEYKKLCERPGIETNVNVLY